VSRYRAAGFLAAIIFSAEAYASLPVAPVEGIVKHLQTPVPGALVFVYGISDATLNRMKTRFDGSFSFESIPAGVYDVVAYKSGYYPSLVRLWHQASPGVSALAIDLTPESPVKATRAPGDVWAWRDRMPADVLREISFEAGDRGVNPAPAGGPSVEGLRLTRVLSGEFSSSEEIGGSSSSSLNRSNLGLSGALPGGLQYGLKGNYSTLNSDSSAPLSSGSAADASLLLATSPESGFGGTFARRVFDEPGSTSPTWEREALLWNSEDEAGGAKADLALTRSAESGFEKATTALPQVFPESSRGYVLRGRWSREEEGGGYRAALLLRRREFSPTEGVAGSTFAQDGALMVAAERPIAGWLSAGARVGARYRPEGTSFCPGGLLSLKLVPETTLVIAGSRRVGSAAAGAAPPFISSEEDVESVSRSEESLTVVVGDDPAGNLRLSATRQDIGESLMIEFDGDLLVDFGSLYLFDGNRLERISGTASARLFDLLDAALTAEGGRLEGKLSPETLERFAVASSSGNFYRGQAALTIRPTKTDISCALRRIRQILQTGSGTAENSSDLVRITLGQDLTVLGFCPFGTTWRLSVAYETSSSPVGSDPPVEETATLKKRFMGGVSISF
jgi:hypothetical protein